MKNTAIITLILFSFFLLVIIASFLYFEYLEKNKSSYLKKLTSLLKKFNDIYSKILELDVYLDFLKILGEYVYLIKLYKLESPTKIGKVILVNLNKLLSLVTEYSKAIRIIKESDIIKPSDFKKIIEDSFKNTIDIIEKDISIIKQKKLIQIIDLIKNINK